MSAVSSVLASRLEALEIQCEEERKQRSRVLAAIARMSGVPQALPGPSPPAAAVTRALSAVRPPCSAQRPAQRPGSGRPGSSVRSARGPPSEDGVGVEAYLRTLKVPRPPAASRPPLPRAPLPPPLPRADEHVTWETPASKPRLPGVARGRVGPKKAESFGRRCMGPCDLYVARLRHEDRMAKLFSFDL